MSEMEYAKIIAKNLKRIFYEHNKTQADVARDLNISKATISSWLNGTRVPRMNKIDLLCHYFNVTRAEIMEEYDPDGHDYYLNPETATAAQEIFDNPDLRALFDAGRDSKPEDLRMAAELLKRLKETNRDG